jgi:hypothetical protein
MGARNGKKDFYETRHEHHGAVDHYSVSYCHIMITAVVRTCEVGGTLTSLNVARYSDFARWVA